VEPATETTVLYERIRDGTLIPQPAHAPPPAFLAPEVQPAEFEQPIFVAREPELARLDKFLEKAHSSHGQVVFITGEPGSGKTLLMQEFTRRAMIAHPDLIVAHGNCNAHTGIGDPYLPFLEILQMLTGDVEARWAGAAITRKHACHLWSMLLDAVSALMDEGPELIDRFVSGAALLARARVGAETQASRLEEYLNRRATGSSGANVYQMDLFEQYTRVLQALARNHPLLLTADDLQWADAGSINLLFHLGRRLSGQRILFVGAFRPGDVELGRGGERHPLEPVANELQRDFGDMRVDLTQSEGRQFVEALLQAEPNQLGAEFRETLYRHTGGHPLFTVELLRGLQERGDLLKDESGQWIEGARINWESLPPRIEAVIAEHINRLPEALQEALAIASVEGEHFTVEAVSRVQAVEAQEVIRNLSGPLSKQHQLVSASGVQRVAESSISRYRFRHFLFHKYLYNRLDEVERVHMHESMGNALEALYGEQSSEIALQLARHFEMAGVISKAVNNLLQAGSKAVQLSAHQEAIAHYHKGLELLKSLPETTQRAQQELALQMSLGVSLSASRGYADPEMGKAYGRARELCQQLGATPELVPVLTGLGGFYSLRAEYQIAREVYEEILDVAKQSADPTLLAIGHWGIGYLFVVEGKFEAGCDHLEQALSFYDSQQHRSLASIYYHDPGVSCLTWLSWGLWALGYPEKALQRSREALALAQELSHPFTTAFALGLAAVLHSFRREPQIAQDRAEAAVSLSEEWGFPFWLALGHTWHGWALVQQGRRDEGLDEMQAAIEFVRMSGARQPFPTCLIRFAEAHAKCGSAGEGLKLLAEAQAEFIESGGDVSEAEAHCLQGELVLQTGMDLQHAEDCFQQAIEIARRQQAKSWELRATMSLSRLWQRQGKRDEARQKLTQIYSWFTEGFNTPDLEQALRLLDELAG
jgi:tetratricopeptide (TPR) repeat protein